MRFGGVVVVGSANMDLVVRTPSFPQPGQTVLGADFGTFPGGKGANQAAAIGKLGGSVRFVGKVGGDPFGLQLIHSLGVCGVETGLTVVDPRLTTGVALITLDENGQNTIVVAPGANAHLTAEEVQDAMEEEQPLVLLVQLEIPLEAVRAALFAVPASTIVVLNPAPAVALDDELLSRVDYLTPNETETEVLTGIRPVDEATCHAAAQVLLNRGVRNVVITRGEEGSYLANAEGDRSFSTFPVIPVDTTAAGDAFSGALALFLANGYPIDQAIYRASAVGAFTTQRLGAQASMPTLREIREFAPMLFT